MVANFKATGLTLKRKRPERPRSARTPHSIQAVRLSVTQSLTHSVRNLLPWDCLVEQSKEFYTLISVPSIQINDCQETTRLGDLTSCCDDLLQNVPVNDDVLTTDEAHFRLSGYANKQNFR